MEESCEICNSTKNVEKYKGTYYCSKHAYQMKRYGFIKQRTRMDPNEIVLYDNYAEIIVYDTYGNERDRTQIDLEDVKKCSEYKWHKHESVRGKEYIFTRINGKPIRLHRFVLDYWDLEREVDHIDGNGLNNKKNNLDIVTHHQNVMNQRKLPSNNISGYMGVHFHSQNHNWVAVIKVNQKNIHLGSFERIEDAIACRRAAELKYFGKNKRSNFE